MTRPDRTVTLILGGARSGKSAYAEDLAAQLGRRVLYVATAEALDDEMRVRVAAHRAGRPSDWTTLEAPVGVGAALLALSDAARADVILVDCLTLLVSNVLLGSGAEAPGEVCGGGNEAWARVQTEVEALLQAHCQLGGHLVVVSNEVGCGVVPMSGLGRIFRDCLGWANQALARAADEVVLMVAGLPVDLKALPLARPGSNKGLDTLGC